MFFLGVLLVILGYWFLPEFVPQFPPQLDHLAYGVGILFIIIGLILFVLGRFGGVTLGGRKYWY
jgi:Family of unknown function (DUF6131)